MDEISHTTGNNHRFLGMDIKFIGGKEVTVYMPHNVDDVLEDFGEILKGNVVNPKTSQLFTIKSDAKYIDDKRNHCYHSITTKIL